MISRCMYECENYQFYLLIMYAIQLINNVYQYQLFLSITYEN
jgi:hypothetical protein